MVSINEWITSASITKKLGQWKQWKKKVITIQLPQMYPFIYILSAIICFKHSAFQKWEAGVNLGVQRENLL